MIKYNLYELGDTKGASKTPEVDIKHNTSLDNLKISSYTIQSNSTADLEYKEAMLYIINGVMTVQNSDQTLNVMSGDCVTIRNEKVTVSVNSGYQALFLVIGI